MPLDPNSNLTRTISSVLVPRPGRPRGLQFLLRCALAHPDISPAERADVRRVLTAAPAYEHEVRRALSGCVHALRRLDLFEKVSDPEKWWVWVSRFACALASDPRELILEAFSSSPPEDPGIRIREFLRLRPGPFPFNELLDELKIDRSPRARRGPRDVVHEELRLAGRYTTRILNVLTVLPPGIRAIGVSAEEVFYLLGGREWIACMELWEMYGRVGIAATDGFVHRLETTLRGLGYTRSPGRDGAVLESANRAGYRATLPPTIGPRASVEPSPPGPAVSAPARPRRRRSRRFG